MGTPRNNGLADELLAEFGKLIEEDSREPTVASPERHAQIRFAYECMRFLTRGSGAQVSCKLYSPLKTMGYVTVEGASIDIMDTEWFSKAVCFASALEVYPLIENKVRLELTFHGLTSQITGGGKT